MSRCKQQDAGEVEGAPTEKGEAPARGNRDSSSCAHEKQWQDEIKVGGSVGRNCQRIMRRERKRVRLFTAAGEEAMWRDAARRRAGAALDERHEAVLCELGS
uniref:Diguanylate phosphodiesterase n=1 Tax=Zea mays TaxID=4577 RepID=A0A1P8YYK4_MAIZE|nr:diguanylate phosphodiesterase [Zea mays]